MPELIIIDGYNIIDNWPELAQTKNHSLEGSREQLCRILANYASYSGNTVWVAFSGQFSGHARAGEETIEGVRAFYSPTGQGTINLLQKLAKQAGSKNQVRVVTNSRVKARNLFDEEISITSGSSFQKELAEAQRQMSESVDSGEEWRYSSDD